MANFQGSGSVLEQPKQRTWNKANGWSTVRTWIGEKQDIFDFSVDLASSLGAEQVDVTDEGPTATVRATYPDAQDTSLDGNQGVDNVEWELLGSDLEKPLVAHGFFDSFGDDTLKNELNEAAKAVKEATPKDGAWGIEAKVLYDMLSNGTEAYVLTRYVLRKTIKVARSSLVQASLTNVNKVEAPTGVPTDLFEIPDEQGDGTIEWLKKPPSVRALGKGKYSIEQEWWGGQWSEILYDGTDQP